MEAQSKKGAGSSLPENELKFWLAFNQLSSIGPKRFARLLNHFPTIEEAWGASASQLRRARIEEKIASELIEKRVKIKPNEELEKVQQHKLGVLTIKDEEYPQLLKEISNPPYLLYYRGQLFTEADELALAVVGTRKISAYGKRITQELVSELTRSGLTIASGLALGIDAQAHLSCLAAQGRTIAVLGNGLDSIYPSANTNLANQIIDSGGLIISEFPIGTPSYKSNFPHRNRIISGLALGTLVVEAGESSGSLITAQLALEQNREVFAVPGPLHAANSMGPNSLIKQGACSVLQTSDIIEALNLAKAPQIVESRKVIPDTQEEAQILAILDTQGVHIDNIIRQTKLDAPTINSILVSMELKGHVKNLGGMTYALTR